MRAACIVALALTIGAAPARAQEPAAPPSGDSVTIRIVNVELRQAVQMLSQYLDRPVLFGPLSGQPVTLETPRPVPRGQVLGLLRSVLESQNQELLVDTAAGVYRVRQRERPAGPAQPAMRPAGIPELFVIHLRHARAVDVAATVNALYGRANALGERQGPPETLPDQLRQTLVPAGPVPAQVAQGAAGRVAALTGDVTIVPDAGTNSLLIRASRNDFDLIQAAITELDVRPLQVLIEVLIAEVRRDASLSFGVSTTLAPSTQSDGSVVSGSTQGLGLGDLVIQVMTIGGGNLSATLAASASRGDATILSRPVLLAANNEQAVITVGSQRPFVQVSRSLPTQSPTRDQVVQYKDVGTSLTVRPTISSNGYVTLEVSQEVNAATAEVQFDAPVISTRTLRTQLLVRDSQTVVLGGLSDQQHESTRGGVPFLSDLPLVGGLFGRATRRSNNTELFVFLTLRILRTDQDADSVTDQRRQRVPGGSP